MFGNSVPSWQQGNDMWASRWAPSQSQVSTKDKNNDDSKTTRPPRRSTILGPATPLNLDDFDLTRGLEASRWATSTPISSTADQLGFGPIPRRGGRRGRRGHVRANSIQLTVNTSPLASGPTLCYDDSSDVVMGENTPVASPVDAHFPQPIEPQKDADGDVVMNDLDDVAAAYQINQALTHRRCGPAQLDQGIKDPSVHPAMRTSVVEWVLVLDTSFILSHLHLVGKLVEAYDRWRCVVMLPWATVMELDGLKKSNRTIIVKNADGVGEAVGLGMLARRANNWCFETMAKKKSGLWGQMREEVIDPKSVKGDAAILDCCRFVKQEKGIKTAILSNDKNLCYRAVVYGIWAVCFDGTPFTADGVMNVLVHSEKSSTPPSRPPGIWSSAEDFVNFPDADPPIESVRNGLCDSRYAVTFHGRDLPSSNRPNGHTQHPSDFGNIAAQSRARSNVSLLLLRVETDLATNMVPLLHTLWIASPEASRNIQEPSTAHTLESIEICLWNCIRFTFDEFYPGKTDVRELVSSSGLARIWNSWRFWLAPELHLPSMKPTKETLTEFMTIWAILWQGLVRFAPDPANANCTFEFALKGWQQLLAISVNDLAAFQ